jgi:uncharacterized radical SAM superfamily Fe-S cluster-containing enzyme/SAM-dependent methyltransferase
MTSMVTETRSERRTLAATKSVCPVCLSVLAAVVVEESGKVFLDKSCKEHGAFRALVWSDSAMYSAFENTFPKEEKLPMTNACPLDCGLCASHEEGTCVAIVEVTSRCNLSCGVCFASTAGARGSDDPSLETIADEFATIIRNGGAARPVQLSGGEPTIRRDLAQVVRMGREMGLKHIEVNTNGVLLGARAGFAKELADAGVSAVYLQFDGFNDDVYQIMRGRKLLALKMRAIENCRESKLAVVLVPTIVKGVNDDQLGEIVRFAAREPIVKGVNIQPATFLGRFPSDLQNTTERTTIPDVVKAIEAQTDGEVMASDFFPIPSLHHSCSAVTIALAGEEGLVPLPRLVNVMEAVGRVENLHCAVTKAIPLIWNVSNERASFERLRRYLAKIGVEIEGAESKKILSISMMAFQDCWTLDCDRMQSCRVHVVRPNGRVVPFCAYYLTSADGRRLYGPSQEALESKGMDEELVIRKAVRDRYSRLATSSRSDCCGGGDGCCDGSEPISLGDAGPAEASSVRAGCGSPLQLVSPLRGDTVLDLGSGGGGDIFRASRLVGGDGRAIGVDATPEMVWRARETKSKYGTKYGNVEFRLGEIERLPVASASVDYVISNCVINLSPDKPAVLREAFRVLKEGGTFAVADVTLQKEIPAGARSDMEAWSACLVGAVTDSEYERLLRGAGFQDVRIEHVSDSNIGRFRYAYFSSHIMARKPLGPPGPSPNTAGLGV